MESPTTRTRYGLSRWISADVAAGTVLPLTSRYGAPSAAAADPATIESAESAAEETTTVALPWYAPLSGSLAKYPVTSKITCTELPVLPGLPVQYMASRVPEAPSGTVTPLARVSPTTKLIVEVSGTTPLVRLGATVTYPYRVWPTIVTLPVTAVASTGMLNQPPTANDLLGPGVEDRGAPRNARIQHTSRRNRVEGRAGGVLREIARDVEQHIDRIARVAGAARAVHSVERSAGPERHRDAVGARVAHREVDRRSGRGHAARQARRDRHVARTGSGPRPSHSR